MTIPLLVLRPQPGAERTAARAREAGFDPLVAPLFAVRPLDWDAPDPERFDALILTSANAARHGGPALARYRHLPAYAVGAATAAAAERAGFDRIVTGTRDAAALLVQAEADGHRRLLHLAGREHKTIAQAGIALERRIVYAADAFDRLPARAAEGLAAGAVALLHSERAASLFRTLIEQTGLDPAGIRIAAISPAVRDAAGPGWRFAAAAADPGDPALLAAARLCAGDGGG